MRDLCGLVDGRGAVAVDHGALAAVDGGCGSGGLGHVDCAGVACGGADIDLGGPARAGRPGRGC